MIHKPTFSFTYFLLGKILLTFPLNFFSQDFIIYCRVDPKSTGIDYKLATMLHFFKCFYLFFEVDLLPTKLGFVTVTSVCMLVKIIA